MGYIVIYTIVMRVDLNRENFFGVILTNHMAIEITVNLKMSENDLDLLFCLLTGSSYYRNEEWTAGNSHMARYDLMENANVLSEYQNFMINRVTDANK